MTKHKDLILYLLPALVIALIYPKWCVDDAAILFRYADNFRHSGQLNWNLGEYFEGYTGTTLLMALIASPFDYLMTAHINLESFHILSALLLYISCLRISG